jgi:hypothetical protein
VRTEDGRVYRRNRRHLRLSQEPSRPDQESSETEPQTEYENAIPVTVNSKPAPVLPIAELPNTAPVQQQKQPVLSSPMKTRSGRVVVKPMRYRDV